MENNVKTTTSRLISVDYAERKMREIIRKYSSDEDILEQKMYSLADKVLDQEQVLGSENSFHNFALNFSKLDDSDTACEVVEKGLLLFPYSSDLLADYLQMGSECGKFEMCEECFKKLMSTGYGTWTWRAYSFSVDYLMMLCTGVCGVKDLNELKQTALEIVSEYRNHMPKDEGSYCSEADIYSTFHEYELNVAALKNGIEKCKNSPKCSLRYADILVDEGNYDEAYKVLQQLIGMVSSQESVNTSYIYYLSGVCKYALLMKSKDFSKTEVILMYNDFQIADNIGLGNETYRRNATKLIKAMEVTSNIKYPAENYPDTNSSN